MPRRRIAAPAAPLTLGLFLCLAALLCAGLALPSPARAVETMEKGGPPPPTPGWAYGPVNYSLEYVTSPCTYYRVTMSIQSPANIWFRYIYKNGPGPRWYHVSAGHQTKCYPGCMAIQAFGVNLSDFGPDSTKRMPWREGEDRGDGTTRDEDASGSKSE